MLGRIDLRYSVYNFYLSIMNTPQSCKKQYLAEERTWWRHLKTNKKYNLDYATDTNTSWKLQILDTLFENYQWFGIIHSSP